MPSGVKELRDLLRSFLLLLSAAAVILHLLSWWQLALQQSLERTVLLGLLAGPFVCLSGQAAFRQQPSRPWPARICGGALVLNLTSLFGLLVAGQLGPLFAL